MGIADDRRELEKWSASPTKSVLDRQFELAIEAARKKRQEVNIFQDLDPETDFIWGNYSGERHPLTYFDYYFTGQDVRIMIEGAENISVSDPDQSPFVELSFSVQQEKTPVYGFWSYTYDAMMRGTRIVTGVFRLVTTYPNRLTDMIAQAATARKDQRTGMHSIRGLDTDERNIELYWDRHIEQKDQEQQKRIWSVHPPFNLLIEYGIQPMSLSPDPTGRFNEVYKRYQTDTAAFTNVNERLVHSGVNNSSTQIILNNVELTGLQAEYSPDGTVCSEVYSFIARDIMIPR